MKRKNLVSNILVLSLIALVITPSLTACGASETSTSLNGSKDYSSSDTYNNLGESDALVGITASGNISSNSSESSNNSDEISNSDNSVEISEQAVDSASESNNQAQQDALYEDKLIYKCSLEIETLSFGESYNQLQSLITKYNGRIQSEDFSDLGSSYHSNGYSNTYSEDKYTDGKEAVLIIRVPSEKYKEFMQESGESLGNVVTKTQTIENITQEYYDTTAQVKGLEAQLQRLEEMMASTDDIEAMIKINSEITSVQSEINSLKTVIKTMDMDTTYSYVYMTLTEVVEYSEAYTAEKTNTFIDRLKNKCKDTWEGFLTGCENLLFQVIGLIPTLVLSAIIIVIIKVLFWNKIKKVVMNNETLLETKKLLNYKEGNTAVREVKTTEEEDTKDDESK